MGGKKSLTGLKPLGDVGSCYRAGCPLQDKMPQLGHSPPAHATAGWSCSQERRGESRSQRLWGRGEDPQGLPPGCSLTKKKYLRAWILEKVFLGTYILKNSSDSEQKEERGQQFGPLAGESQSWQQQAASCQGSGGDQKELRVRSGGT